MLFFLFLFLFTWFLKILFIELWIKWPFFFSLSQIKPCKLIRGKKTCDLISLPLGVSLASISETAPLGLSDPGPDAVAVPWDSECSLLTTDAWFKRVFMNHRVCVRDHFLGNNFFLLQLRKVKGAICLIILGHLSVLFIFERVSAIPIRYPFAWIKWMF